MLAYFSINTFFRYLLILYTNYISSTILYVKISKITLTKYKYLYLLLSSTIICITCAYLGSQDFWGFRICYELLLSISFVLLFHKKYYISLPLCIVSICISYISEITSVLLFSVIFFIVGYNNTNILNEFFASILQIVLVLIIMRMKRIKNGMPFFTETSNFGICIVLSGPVFVCSCLQKQLIPNIMLSVIFIGIAISSTGLFIWLRSAFTRYYRKKLKARAEEYSKLELAEKNKEIERLTTENASLSSIIHLDNYLIKELETSLKNKNDETTNNLLILSKQRNEYVNNQIINEKLLPTTGNDDIDAVISDLYIKTASRGIDFTLNANCDVNYLIHNIIEQTDFEELIRSCITNSIVNIENNPDTNGKILITISKPNDIYEFTIMDSGIIKDDSIKSISEIIEKSNASIKTNTFDNIESFTKSLTIRFDGLKNNTEF